MPPVRLDERVQSLEAGMSALEQLPSRMDRLESQIVQLRAELRDGDQETRTQMGVLHEETIGRIAAIGEGVAAQREELRALSRIVMGHGEQITTLADRVTALASETRTMFKQIMKRL